MSTETNAPKVFISYSWKPIQNKQKVIRLAERLTLDFVHVILDDWDLAEGQDKYQFMEQMISNPEIKRVLIICNKDYKEKANLKKGGVGTESLIISDEIYKKADQKKFIPVIFEKDEKGNAFAPTFIHSRIYIDLSSDEVFEDEYEKLIRNIFDKPSSKRPPLGTMPAYLQTEEPIYLPTAHKVLTIKNALISEKKNAPLLIQNYLDTFVSAVDKFSIKVEELTHENFDEVILKRIEDLIVLRNDFIDFLETYTSNSITIDAELLHRFFEKLLEYLLNNDSKDYPSHTFGYLKSDSTNFFYYELFLTFTAFMLEKEKFTELAYILQTPFIVEFKNRGEINEWSFIEFRQFVSTLNEHRNKKYNLNRVSITADTIKQRATDKIKFEKLVEADILLYYISLLFPNSNPNSYYPYWFPETSCYRSYRPPILAKTISERYFNRVKVLFGVDTKEQLIEKVNEIIKNNAGNIQNRYYNIPHIKVGLRIDDLCKLK